MHNDLKTQNLESLSIVGVGLLGGSVGLAFRAAGGTAERVGVGRRRSSITRAVEVGAIDRGTLSYRSGVGRADLVIVATPLGHFKTVFRQLADHLPDGAVVTDVGSTKASVMEWAAELLPPTVRFVGSHPMAGSETAGVDFARADLFHRAQCFIVPSDRADEDAVALVEGFWRKLGMRTRQVTPDQHDRIVAQISHLPHVVASALMEVAVVGESLDSAATGFADTTRVASGSPGMWADILMTNRRGVCDAVDELVERLLSIRKWLDAADTDQILQFLERSQKARDAWVQRRYAEREIEP
ncbi:MAG: prephenate dehydrogenase [Phycisphaerae bacterium]|nr:prephenate dehydrogenase [Phycisphaerae bacterium]